MGKRAVILPGVLLVLFGPPAAFARANSAIDQYIEKAPAAGGNNTKSNSGSSKGQASKGASSDDRSLREAVGSRGADIAPALTGDEKSGRRPSNAPRGRDSSDPSGHSPPSSEAQPKTGAELPRVPAAADSGGGWSPLLILLLLAPLAGLGLWQLGVKKSRLWPFT